MVKGKAMLVNFGSRAGVRVWRGAFGAALLAASAAGAAPAPLSPPAVPTVAYADVAGLIEASTIVAAVEVHDQALVEAARAPGLAPGHARLYLEARTLGLLWGRAGLGQNVAFLADVPLLANGKPPKLTKQRLLLFADSVPAKPGNLQLVAPDAFIPASVPNEQLARTVIAQLAAPDAPPRIKGVRDVMSVAGNLVGESETQLFVDTTTGAPVSVTVIRRPGQAPQWGVSWSEIVDQSAKPPAPETVAWYRLACSLPRQLPPRAFLQQDAAARTRAEADYALVIEQLGECVRIRR